MGMYSKTPSITVSDPRGLTILAVDYWRNDESLPCETRTVRTLRDGAGRAVKQWDARLWALHANDPQAPCSLASVYGLNDKLLRSDSNDAGMQLELHGFGGEMRFGWDSRGTRRDAEYDELLRPVAVFEQGAGGPRRCIERLSYGREGDGDCQRNQFGQLTRHDDPAGTELFDRFAITGQCLESTRHFTCDPVDPDWLLPLEERQRLLEPGEGATSHWRFTATGQMLGQIDARCNRQEFELTLDGRLRAARLQLKGQPDVRPMVSEIRYNADGRVEHELAGNGVRTTQAYRPEDGRLMARKVASAAATFLQLSYDYDPMGNVLSIEDQALPTRYFANQRIEPVSHFIYDSLYQLSQATGWEAGAASKGPESSSRIDPAALVNYRQSYRYDAAGNLLELTHVGAQAPARRIKTALYSNRGLPWRNGVPPTEEQITAAFDARGNSLELDQGRFVRWNLRNQLQSVSPVERASQRNDEESYRYDANSQRVEKVRALQTNARTLLAQTRYLPGLELRTDSGSGEILQVIIAQTGLHSVNLLHWETSPPTGGNDRIRYTFTDHLGSASLELGEDARIISQETFHPFGETAWSKDSGVSYKTIRYSGKERDATGLYYYGLRYYIPWLQRWLNPDPAGIVDGLNLFWMLRNSPINRHDENGTTSYDVLNEQETYAKKKNIKIISKGLDSFPTTEREATSEALELGLEWVTNAEKALSQPSLSPSTQKILTMMFDEHDFSSAGEKDSFTSLLLADMQELKSFMTIFLDKRNQQVVLVDQLPGMDALAFNTANDGNSIWVSQSYIERSHRVSQARTMVHEAAHAMRRNNALNFVNDFMYLNFGEEGRAASKEEINDYVLLGRLSSGESMGSAPDESTFSARTLAHYKNAVNTVLEKLGKSPATSPRKRADAYIGQVKVRQNVARRNADSLSVFAMQFRR
jgi:insecticidal toxin complex protein TccC